MSVFTSDQFASVIVAGDDWRDCSKAALEQFESVRTKNDGFNFGFLYVSDLLADDLESILNLFRSVMDIEHWVGCVGIGVCGNNQTYIDQPALSAMITKFEEEDFHLFNFTDSDTGKLQDDIQPFFDQNQPMLVLSHLDPTDENKPVDNISKVSAITGGFVVGGLSSSRDTYKQISGDVQEKGVHGALFSDRIQVATALSQAYETVGETHIITKGSDHFIHELDGEKALDVFDADLRSMVIKKIDKDPDEIRIDEEAMHDPSAIPEEFRGLFDGEIHVGFPNPRSDMNDLLVRNIIGLDQDSGTLAVSQMVCSGEKVVFVNRNAEILKKDLSHALVELRKRVEHDYGTFNPKAALYISCIARAMTDLSESNENSNELAFSSEMDIIHEIIGDVPLTGFYASGEISNAQLYGYTGVLTLFL